MDQSVLVSEAQLLTRLLDATKIRPKAAMWVHEDDPESWRLWIVPSSDVKDRSEFYRIIAETLSMNRASLPSLDVAATKFVEASHPAIRGMDRYFRLTDIGSTKFDGNRFEDFFLSDGIVIRMDLEHH